MDWFNVTNKEFLFFCSPPFHVFGHALLLEGWPYLFCVLMLLLEVTSLALIMRVMRNIFLGGIIWWKEWKMSPVCCKDYNIDTWIYNKCNSLIASYYMHLRKNFFLCLCLIYYALTFSPSTAIFSSILQQEKIIQMDYRIELMIFLILRGLSAGGHWQEISVHQSLHLDKWILYKK